MEIISYLILKAQEPFREAIFLAGLKENIQIFSYVLVYHKQASSF